MTKKTASWLPVVPTYAEAMALAALASGTANPEQQKRALQFVIEKAASTYDLAYRPDSARDTDFALGRAFVGQQLVKIVKNPQAYKEKTK